MKKYELEALLAHFIDICDGEWDPYEEDSMRLIRIRDLAAQAIGKKEKLSGAFSMPELKRKK
jgi:hypothetical protein